MRTVPSDVYQAKAMASLLTSFNLTRVNVIASIGSFGDGVNSFLTEAANQNLNITSFYAFDPSASPAENVYVMLANFIKTRSRVVVAWLTLEDAKIVVDAAVELGLVGKDYVWVVPDSLAQTSFVDWLQESSDRLSGLQGMIGLQMSRITGQTQAQQDFLNATNGLQPEYDAYAPFAYDAITAVGIALNTALQNSQDPLNGEAFMETLLATSFTGLTGAISFDANGDVLDNMGVYQVVNLQSTSLVDVGSVDSFSFSQTGPIEWASGSTGGFSGPKVLTHAVMPNDATFWQVFKSGIDSAYVDYRMIIDYHDLSEYANEANIDAGQLMIEQLQSLLANTSKTIDGIITTATDPYAMLPTLQDAAARGITIIIVNTPIPDDLLSEYTQIATYLVSQDEIATATKAAQVFLNSSRNHLLVINHEPSSIAMQSRLEGLSATYITISQMNVSLVNDFTSELHSALASDTTIDSVITLGASTVPQVLSVLASFNRSISFGTFDMNPVIYDAINKGKMLFGIHQYQWIEAYFTVGLMSYYLTTKTVLVEPRVLVGSFFFNSANLEDTYCDVMQLNYSQPIPHALCGTNDPITVEFSYGGDPKSTFWVSPTAGAGKGADQAATDMQTTVRKSTANTVGFANTYKIVNATLDKKKIQGLAMTLTDPACVPTFKKAISMGVPVTVLNAGIYQFVGYDPLYIAGVAMDDYPVGTFTAKRLIELGFKKALITQDVSILFSTGPRLQGFADVWNPAGLKYSVLNIDSSATTDFLMVEQIKAAYTNDESVDCIITFSSRTGEQLASAVRQLGITHKVGAVIGASIRSDVLFDAVRSGDITFSVEQQPLLQGYLSTAILAMYLRTKNRLGQTIFKTGPYLLSHDNFYEFECAKSLEACPVDTLCPLGQYLSSADKLCYKCPPGTYQPSVNALDIVSCIPCSIGTANPLNGSSSSTACIPCDVGTYSDTIGQSKCTKCSGYCSVSSVSDRSSYTYEPFKFPPVDDSNSGIDVLIPIIIAGCVFLAALTAVAVFILKFMAPTSPIHMKVRGIMKSIDQSWKSPYSLKTLLFPNSYSLAGWGTIVCYLVFIIYCIYYIVVSVQAETNYQSFLPILDKQFEPISLKIDVKILGSLPDCTSELVAIGYTGIETGKISTSVKHSTGQCQLTWSIDNMVNSQREFTIAFNLSTSPLEFANAISYSIQLPNATGGNYANYTGTVYPDSEDNVFCGNSPIAVGFSVFHSAFYRQKGNTTREGAETQTTYVVTAFSQASKSTFAANNGVNLLFDFVWSDLYINSVTLPQSTAADIVTGIGGLVSYLSTGLFLVGVPFVLLEKRKTSKKYQGNEPEDIDVELHEYYANFQEPKKQEESQPSGQEEEDNVFEMKPT